MHADKNKAIRSHTRDLTCMEGFETLENTQFFPQSLKIDVTVVATKDTNLLVGTRFEDFQNGTPLGFVGTTFRTHGVFWFLQQGL